MCKCFTKHTEWHLASIVTDNKLCTCKTPLFPSIYDPTYHFIILHCTRLCRHGYVIWISFVSTVNIISSQSTWQVLLEAQEFFYEQETVLRSLQGYQFVTLF